MDIRSASKLESTYIASLNIWDDYSLMLESRCNFLHPELRNDVAAYNNHEITVAVVKLFEGSIDPDLLRMIVLELLAFVVPLTPKEGQKEQYVPWLFKKKGRQQVKLV